MLLFKYENSNDKAIKNINFDIKGGTKWLLLLVIVVLVKVQLLT